MSSKLSAKVLPDNAYMGRVALSVADLGRSLTFYQEQIGFYLLRTEGETAVLGTPERELLHLQEQPGARPTRGTTGLYHYALLLPSRLDLAKTLRHLINTETRLDGAADHNVSEALYLTDPDGHGIEIYRDRPRDEWQYVNGQLKMGTDAFDVNGVLREINGHFDELSAGRSSKSVPLPDQTTMGHVHLHVSQLNESLDFYTNVVGFDLIMRYGPSAGFVSAGGYHHHLGLNTWAGVGAPPAPDETARLLWYEIVVDGETAVIELEERLENADVNVERNGRSLQFQDPSENLVRFTSTLS